MQKKAGLRWTNIVRSLLLILMATGLWFCANVVAPKGGPKDESPPQLLTEGSTPNMQTNFNSNEIILEFDEWVELNDVFNQIVISPPIDRDDYEVRIRKKSIIFSFTETASLRENATYTINFGEAVRDITERNPVKDLRFVFSTGDVIDSLVVRGKLLDALTGEPVEDAYFMLYENLADSVVRTINPFYFGRTDESGNYTIENVRAGTFKGFGIKRVDQNYKFDNPEEFIGFPEEFIVVGDTTGITPDSLGNRRIPPKTIDPIFLFQERKPLYISNIDSSRYGFLNTTFNVPPGDIDLQFEDLVTENEEPPYTLTDRDSLLIWYNQSGNNTWRLMVQKDSLLNDTISIKARSKTEFQNTGTLNLRMGNTTNQGKSNPSNPIKVGFSAPLENFDTSFITLTADTTLEIIKPEFSIDSLDNRRLTINYSWKPSIPYVLEILPGGVTDMFGLSNQDTVNLKYTPDLKKSFGNIKISITGLKDSLSYIGELLDKNSRIIESFVIVNAEAFELEVNALPPGDYKVKIITDWNNNGSWDTGSYDDKRQPEPIYEKALEKLRANWDVEATVNPEEN
ncbi:MAG: hypothetical protein DWQ02_14910 [Bacteroidetes bacterium]|nr:MAG: hypothetical protein DWQ02_14910 [Bacteroidota bacterium]